MHVELATHRWCIRLQTTALWQHQRRSNCSVSPDRLRCHILTGIAWHWACAMHSSMHVHACMQQQKQKQKHVNMVDIDRKPIACILVQIDTARRRQDTTPGTIVKLHLPRHLMDPHAHATVFDATDVTEASNSVRLHRGTDRCPGGCAPMEPGQPAGPRLRATAPLAARLRAGPPHRRGPLGPVARVVRHAGRRLGTRRRRGRLPAAVGARQRRGRLQTRHRFSVTLQQVRRAGSQARCCMHPSKGMSTQTRSIVMSMALHFVHFRLW